MNGSFQQSDQEEPVEGNETPAPDSGFALGEEPVAQPGGPGREVEESVIPDEPLTKAHREEPPGAAAGEPRARGAPDEELWERPAAEPPVPSGEERALAALAHGSVLLDLASGVGILVPLLLWVYYRDRSRFVSFHSVQALFFQAAALAAGFILAILAGIVLVIGVVTSLFLVGVPLIILALAVLAIGLLVPVLAMVYGVYGAYQTYRGRDFRYWLIADLVGEERVGR